MFQDAVDAWAGRAVFAALARLRHGRLVLQMPGATRQFGAGAEPDATLRIHHPRFFRRVLSGAEIGLGDAYMDGDWSTPDLVALVRLMLANQDVAVRLPGAPAWLSGLRDALRHRWRDNSRAGSRRNIHEHYDLGNDFFRLFLDCALMYSCAYYDRADDTLDCAQQRKLQLIADKLALSPDDHLLEIGTGWGGFAVFAARHYGCRVTTTTISAEQHAYASDLVARSPDVAARIAVRFDDYRDLRGRFDKIVSIEMFEAVGLQHYDEFFSACHRLLAPEGTMLLQTITVDDWRFREYRSGPNWIAKRIFPGAELASVAEILASLARVTRLRLVHAQEIGAHYALTLRHWRERFHARLDDVRGLGYDERFIRMWDLYLGYCEAAFMDRHIGDVQLLLAKSGRGSRGSRDADNADHGARMTRIPGRG